METEPWMADQLTLEIVTPKHQVLETETPWVTLPGVVGELGILPQHVPLLTSIDSGVLSWQQDGETKFAAIHYGYAQVNNDRVTVLAEMVERRSEIDAKRAQQADRRARDELRKALDEADSEARTDKYEAKLRRAASRLRASV